MSTNETTAKTTTEPKETPEQKRIRKAQANLVRYPHALPETMAWSEEDKKLSVSIVCRVCGSVREHVHTSDLFQVSVCEACHKDLKKAAKKAKKETEKATKTANEVY